MLKNYLFAAGALLAAIVQASPQASASTHHAYRGHRGLAFHGLHAGAYLGRPRSFARVRPFARGRSYAGIGRHYGSHGHRFVSRRYAGPQVANTVRSSGDVVAWGHAYGERQVAVASRNVASQDKAIQSYVGPRAAYTPVSSGGGGGQVGGASYYSGGRTASGGVVGAATCAHRTLPFGTRVLVTNLSNSRSAVLTVNDRGPFIGGRIVDVSRTAAGTLGMLGSGVARVSLKVVGRG